MVVHVKDKTSTKEYDAYQSMPFEVTVNNLNLHVDKVSPQPTGSKVILTANTPVSENLLYRFLVKSKTTGNETILADYSSNSTTEWIPCVGGDYELIFRLK
jgi:hypothetical protein